MSVIHRMDLTLIWTGVELVMVFDVRGGMLLIVRGC